MIPVHAEIGHEYHVVEMSKVTNNLKEWLEEKFGPPGHRWFIANHNKIYFRDEKDWMWFELGT